MTPHNARRKSRQNSRNEVGRSYARVVLTSGAEGDGAAGCNNSVVNVVAEASSRTS